MNQSETTLALLSILDKKGKHKLTSNLFTNNISVINTYLIYRILYDKYVDPDILLHILIDQMHNNTFLSPCSFCLRMNGNPNKYIRMSNYGEIHIISYVYIKVTIESLRNNLIYMLLLAGGNPQLRNYKDSPENKSVSQWLRDNFSIELDIGNIYTNLQTKEFSDILRIPAILMNKFDMIDIIQTPINSEEHEIILLSRADELYSQLTNMKNAISFLNAQAFAFIANAITPNYLISNQILIRMKDNRGNQYSLQELAVMLSFVINRGVNIDEEQYIIVKSLGKNLIKLIDKAYKVPYWKKVCENKADDTIDNRLKSLAISLGIDPSNKTEVCSSIENISKSDPQKAIIASLRRQKTIMLGEIANISELIGKPPNMVCRNRADFEIDPMGYNSLDVSSYRDSTGAIWCFLSETYPNLLLERINPYTGQPMPEDYLTIVNQKLERLKDLGIYKTVPINKALEELKIADDISNTLSNEILQSMFRVMEINEINVSKIENMSVEGLQMILDNAEISVTITPFTKKHALFTIARIFNLSNDEELSRNITQMQLV